MKIAALTLMAPLLASCAVPGAAMLAGIAVEGGSVMATGRTATDQALSAATKRDCRLLAGLTQGRLCSDDKSAAPSVMAKAAVRAEPAALKPARIPVPHAHVGNRWTLLIGTFWDIGAATRMAGLARPHKTSISSTVMDGRVVYQVTVGAFPFEETEKFRAKVSGPGIDKITVMRLCPSWMKEETCISLDRTIERAPQVAKAERPVRQ